MLDHGTKSVIIVNTFSLLETLGDETGFVSINRSICFIFQLENPLAINYVEAGSMRYKAPRIIAMQGRNLIVHC